MLGPPKLPLAAQAYPEERAPLHARSHLHGDGLGQRTTHRYMSRSLAALQPLEVPAGGLALLTPAKQGVTT
jgi:hypothetical protein